MEVVSYEQIRALVSPFVKTGQSYSLPVPVLAADGRIYDKVFLYSMNRAEGRPYPPSALLVVDLDGAAVGEVAAKDAFPDVQWCPSGGYSGGRYKELAAQAKTIYGPVREEVEGGALGESAKLYGRLLAEITPRCLLPYYRALSLDLFTLAERGE